MKEILHKHVKLIDLIKDIIPYINEEVESASFIFCFKNKIIENDDCMIRIYGSREDIAKNMIDLIQESNNAVKPTDELVKS